MGWRYILQALPSGDIIESELPLQNASITDTLSGPRALSGSLPIELSQLKKPNGETHLDEWSAAIWAEADGEIRGGGIITRTAKSGPQLSVECTGFTGYLQGLPYTGNGKVWTRVDPMDVVRHIWQHAQSYPDGNLGVIVDNTTSPVRLGEEEYVPIWTEAAGSDTTFDEGPIRLNWYDVHDLGGFIDDLAERGHFDYAEHTAWENGQIVHRLRMGYPRIGRRRDDLRFVIGENVGEIPEESLVEEGYAGYVRVLGAGEGREKVDSKVLGSPTGRLRRVAVIVDDTIKRESAAVARARKERKRRLGVREITTLVVRDHPNAPIGSWRVGDDIRVVGRAGWSDLDMWVRIVESSISPESGEIAQLSVVAAEEQ